MFTTYGRTPALRCLCMGFELDAPWRFTKEVTMQKKIQEMLCRMQDYDSNTLVE